MTLEFTTDTTPLTAALDAAVRFADKRNGPAPILGNIVIRGAGDHVVCLATDMLISLTATIPATVVKSGSVSLSAAHFLKVIKTLGDATVTVRGLDNHWAQIVAGKSEFKLMGMPETDFPALPDPERGAKGNKPVAFAKVTGSVLANLFDMVGFSVSTDTARVNLNGVLLEGDGKTATIVSTDGHRLTKYTRPMEGLVLDKGIIIPRRGVVELQRVLARHPGELEFGVGLDTLFVRTSDLVLSVKLTNVTFPPYKQVIPAYHTREVRVRRGDLLAALRRVEVLAPEKTASMRLRVMEGGLALSADDPDRGATHHEIDAEVSGKELEAGFNARYLMAAVEVLDSEYVRLEFQNELDPCVVKSDGEGIDFTAVVMPMRI